MAKIRNALQLPPIPENYDRSKINRIFQVIIEWTREATALINGELDYPENLIADPQSSPQGTGTAGKITKWLTSTTVNAGTNTDVEVTDAVTKKHDAATAGSGISVSGQEVINADKGTDARTAHEAAYNHSGVHSQNTDAGTTSTSFYLGSATVDGSWQISISGSDLLIQRRESGIWVIKGTFS